MLRKMARLVTVTALAAGAAIATMAVPAAQAATTQAGQASAAQSIHAVTTRSASSNVTPDAGNGCANFSQNGWNIGICANTETFEAWGDAYINSHGVMPQGCTIELFTTDSGGTTLFSNYPCSTFGHIGPNTYTGLTIGDQITTTVIVHGDFGDVFSHSYTN